MTLRKVNLRHAIIVLFTVLVVSVSVASWTAVVLMVQAADSHAEQSQRAEARTELVRQDVEELLDDLRDPDDASQRREIWRTAQRVERLVEDLHDMVGDG